MDLFSLLETVADEGGSDLYISFNASPMIKKKATSLSLHGLEYDKISF